MQNLKKTARWLIVRDNTWLAIGSFLIVVFICAIILSNPAWGPIRDGMSNFWVIDLILLLEISLLMSTVIWPFLVFPLGGALISYWTRNWPERYVMQAQELLKTNLGLKNVLTSLIEKCECTGNHGDLKKWLDNYRELESARQDLEAIEQELIKEKERRERQVELQIKISDLVTILGLPT